MLQSISKESLLNNLQHHDFLVNWHVPETQCSKNYICRIVHDPLATHEGQLKICPLDQSTNLIHRLTIKEGRKLLAKNEFGSVTIVKKSALQKVGEILSGQEVVIRIKQANHACFLKFNPKEYTFTTASIRSVGGSVTLSMIDAIRLCLHGEINNAELLTEEKLGVNIPEELKVIVL